MLKKSKVEIAHEHLQKLINGMDIGSRMPPVRQLMQELEVSQLTVMQALSRLEADGILNREPGLGFFVRSGNCIDTAILRIGLLVPDWPSQSISELEEMMKLIGNESGCQVMRSSYRIGDDIHNHLPIRDYDVIAIVPDINAMTPEFIYRIGTAPIPIILCWEYLSDIKINCVSGDPFITGAQAASYLIRRGHKKLALAISEPLNSSVIKSRVDGFRIVAESSNCELTIIDANVVPGMYSQNQTHKVLSAWLKENKVTFSAIYVVSDETALAVIRALNDHGIEVPGQVSVMGSDGLRQGAFYSPPLTAIAVSAEREAASVIAMAKKLAENPKQILQECIIPEIIERESVSHFSP